MHLFNFPHTTKELLDYLRDLPAENHQYLLDAYTQSLSFIHDDLHSLFIFLDFINLSIGLSETEEIEHLYNLFKVKLRKFKIFWINYISFEVKERKKPFGGVFSKVLEYLKVKMFEGKEELVESLIGEMNDLKEQLIGVCMENSTEQEEKKKEIRLDGSHLIANDENSLLQQEDKKLEFKYVDSIIRKDKAQVEMKIGDSLVKENDSKENMHNKLKEANPCLFSNADQKKAEFEEKDKSTIRSVPDAQVEESPLRSKNAFELNLNDLDIAHALGQNKMNHHNPGFVASEKTRPEISDHSSILDQINGSIVPDSLSMQKMPSKLRFSPNKRPISTLNSPLNSSKNKRLVGHTDGSYYNAHTDGVFSCEALEKTITFNQKNDTIPFKEHSLVCINRIGKGGYSNVYRVCHNGELYALKQIRIDDQEGLNICLDEINLLKKLRNCEFVIQMADYEITKDLVNILLEYGETDLQKLIHSGNMSIFYIKYIWESILKIICFIHSNRIVHRDIKPANFVLVKGKVKIIDFGISKSIRGDTTSILNHEKAGTVNYMSPEQWTGRKVGRSSDIWSAGCILYHMIFKKTVHNGKGAMDYYRIMAEEAEIEYGEGDIDAIESIKACLIYDSKKRAKPEELLEYKFLKK